MKSTILLPLIAATFFSLPLTASFGQDTSKREALAAQLIDELHLERLFDTAFDSVAKMQAQMAASKVSSPQQDRFNKQMQASMQAAKGALDWDSIKPTFAKIYADNFDEADLQGMIDFYKTPLGQKWIDKQPQIQTATMEAMRQFMPKVQAAIMKAAIQSASPAPATKTP